MKKVLGPRVGSYLHKAHQEHEVAFYFGMPPRRSATAVADTASIQAFTNMTMTAPIRFITAMIPAAVAATIGAIASDG